MIHVILPFRKQCQTVEGQEWHHPKSSSSESDDMQKMPDSDSLFAYWKKAKWCWYFTAKILGLVLHVFRHISNLHLCHHSASNTNRKWTWREIFKECSKCERSIFISFSWNVPSEIWGFHSPRFISHLWITLCLGTSILQAIVPWLSTEPLKTHVTIWSNY